MKNEELKKAVKDSIHTVNRAELRGQAQCQEHSWRKLGENELICTKCPTAIKVENIENYEYER